MILASTFFHTPISNRSRLQIVSGIKKKKKESQIIPDSIEVKNSFLILFIVISEVRGFRTRNLR